MRLVFLGPPGSGKGTQAALLSQRRQVEPLSSGDLLREAADRGDPLGRQVKGFMEAGGLVPDRVVEALVLTRLERFGKRQSFVLDGFPRTESQARSLDRSLARWGQMPIDLAVHFEISEERVIARLAGRRVCAGCRTNYHLQTLPPREPGRCDHCGGAIIPRPDDAPETIRKRWVVYQQESRPLVAFYEGQGKLRRISGDACVEEQYQALLQLLRGERLADASPSG